MASYNGESFIVEQIDSILKQIGTDDELIIVDDCSTDKTLSLLKNTNDSRIRLFQTDKNVGHVGAFEMALSRASNDIIFLSDQDDIWKPSKYDLTLQEFQHDAKLAFVVHSLSAADERGNLICDDWLSLTPACKHRSQLLLAELIKPQVFGSASAFRRELLALMLPFPIFVYAHDHWLLICAAINGEYKFLSDHLVLRRIHENNVTPKSGLSITKKVYYRSIFVLLILTGIFRSTVRRMKHVK